MTLKLFLLDPDGLEVDCRGIDVRGIALWDGHEHV
jgi:hypothetical protein